jgi:hypothetical protein
VNVTILDTATPHLQELRKQMGDVGGVIGQAGANRVKDHLRGLASARHKGGTPANFYADAYRSTTWAAGRGSVTITVAKLGMSQRYYGGHIAPVRGKYLTIPTDAARGRRAREFSGLRFGFAENQYGNLAPALLAPSGGATLRVFHKTKGETGKTIRNSADQVMFWLVKHVFQRADPSVLPTGAEIATACLGAVERRLARIQTRAVTKTMGGRA